MAAETQKQFDPAMQFADVLNDVDVQIENVRAAFDRLRWLRGRLVDELDRLTDAADEASVTLYDEPAAAKMLGIKTDLLASLRRNLTLPHVAFSTKIRYTRRHLAEIIEILEVRKGGKGSRFQIPDSRLKAA